MVSTSREKLAKGEVQQVTPLGLPSTLLETCFHFEDYPVDLFGGKSSAMKLLPWVRPLPGQAREKSQSSSHYFFPLLEKAQKQSSHYCLIP